MRAAFITRCGAPDSIRLGELPDPIPGPRLGPAVQLVHLDVEPFAILGRQRGKQLVLSSGRSIRE